MISKNVVLTGLIFGTVLLHNSNLLTTYASETIHQVPSLTVESNIDEISSIGPGIPTLNMNLSTDEIQQLNSGSNIAEYATQFVGNPYVYGGISLTNGADCSGFTQSVFKEFNIYLPRTSSEQRHVGVEVNGLENALPGDLITYYGHVGIYIGEGKIVHSSTPKEGIMISAATIKPIVSIRRVK